MNGCPVYDYEVINGKQFFLRFKVSPNPRYDFIAEIPTIAVLLNCYTNRDAIDIRITPNSDIYVVGRIGETVECVFLSKSAADDDFCHAKFHGYDVIVKRLDYGTFCNHVVDNKFSYVIGG